MCASSEYESTAARNDSTCARFPRMQYGRNGSYDWVMSMLLLTGASGRVARRAAALLAHRGYALRLMTRTPQRAPELEGAEVRKIAIARVVHQYVDAPESLLGLPHGLSDLRPVRHIQLQSERIFFMPGNESCQPIGIARSHYRTPAPGQHELCKFLTEAGRTTGDKPYRRLLLCHSVLHSLHSMVIVDR